MELRSAKAERYEPPATRYSIPLFPLALRPIHAFADTPSEGFWSVAAVCDRRRVGKTTLSHSMQGVSYFDCELRRVRRIIEEDPEGFLGQDLELLT